MLHFVEVFIDTPIGPVPRVKTQLERTDLLGTISARLGIERNQYEIAPGLYSVGNPGQDSPVLVTANYKLSFDTLRRELTSLDAWILVIDTRAINVWCAAGKELFCTREVVRCVNRSMLNKVVRHNQLVLPQPWTKRFNKSLFGFRAAHGWSTSSCSAFSNTNRR